MTEILIVGAGAAGHSAASTLRREGFTGSIRLLHDEPGSPYNRTLVDKGILPGLLTQEQAGLPIRHVEGLDLVPGRAVAVDPAERSVRLEDGRELGFRQCLLAVGSAPRSAPDSPLNGVFPLHRAADALRIRDHVAGDFAGRSVTVLGAGLIGTEAASFFVAAGAEVHLVARSDLPLVATLGIPIATRLRDLHREHTTFHGGRAVTSLRRASNGGVEVRLDSGITWESDLVVTSHGTPPATGWVSAGSTAGIGVDRSLRADALPRMYAAGGAVLYPWGDGTRVRVDHWDDAVAQGAHVARSMLHDLSMGEDPGPYRPVSGYSVSMYGSSLTGVGIRAPGTRTRTETAAEGGLVTTFAESTGGVTGAVGWKATRAIQALRQGIIGA